MMTAIGAVVVLPFAIWGMAESAVPLWLPLATGAASAVVHAGYFMLLQQGYRVGDVSIVYPLARGSGPLLSVILAILLLGERPSALGLLGAAVVVTGVFVIGFAGGIAGAARARAGIFWGLAVGVAIAVYTLWDAYAVTDLGVPPGAHMLAIALGQLAIFTPYVLRDRAALRLELARSGKAALVAGLLGQLSYLVILVAFQLAPVALVAPGREVSVVLVGLAGWLLFKEPHPVQRLIGCVIVIAGVALLALG